MANYYDTTWYVNGGDGSTTGYYAVPKRQQNAVVVAGQLCRQFTTPAVNNERVYVCTTAGTTANTVDATWTVGHGDIITDGTVKWVEITGCAAMNGDNVHTLTWGTPGGAGISSFPMTGQIVKRNNGASYQICTVLGFTGGGAEPAFSDVAGTTTVDGGATWTSLGPVANFLNGGAPFARLASVGTSYFLAGNTIYVADNHVETSASSVVLGGVSGFGQTALQRILCHKHLGTYPPTANDITTGAVISSQGSVTFGVGSGVFYFNGIAFRAGVGSSTATINVIFYEQGNGVQNVILLENCSCELYSTGGNSSINLGINTGQAHDFFWRNCTVKFATTTDSIGIVNSKLMWQGGGLLAGSAIPSIFIKPVDVRMFHVVLEGLDLTALTGSLFGLGSLTPCNLLLNDCKLSATATVPTFANTGAIVQLARCDSGNGAYKSTRYAMEAVETTETSIVRAGGAADPTGQVQSRRIFTNANAQWLLPYRAEPYAMWNSITGGNVTVTVYGLINTGVIPNNDDIWLEVDYLGSSSSTLGTVATTTKANALSIATPVPSDSSVWSNLPSAISFTPFSATTAVNTTLTNNNLTATHSTTTPSSGVSSIGFVTSKKYYYEITAGVMNVTGGWSDAVGAINSLGTVAAVGSSFANSMVIGSATAQGYNQAGSFGSAMGSPPFVTGDVISVALDMDAKLGWLRRNGGPWFGVGTNNPVTGVGGAPLHATAGYAPVVSFNNSTAVGSQYTLNVGATSFAYQPPVGFVNLFTPFKLSAVIAPRLPGYVHVRVRVAKPNMIFYVDPKITLT